MDTKKVLHTIRKHIGRIVLVLNCIAILLVWLCCASTYLHPSVHPRLALVGLSFPLLISVELLFFFAWILVNYRRAWIPLAGLLPCISYVLDYCPVSFRTTVPDHCLKVVTWNCNGFGGSTKPKEEGWEKAIQYLENCDADIICLQESSAKNTVINAFYSYMDSAGYEKDQYLGLTLLTKLPIVDKKPITYTSKHVKGTIGNGSMSYTLRYKDKDILLVNNHLESNHLKTALKDEYAESLSGKEYEKLKESGHSMEQQISASTSLRGSQADSLYAFAERNKGKDIIVCGDFNDTPISYVYQRVNKQLKNAFKESGRGIGVSFNKKGFWVRIDHLFVSDHWQTYYTHIDKSVSVSDHYPLVSWLKLE